MPPPVVGGSLEAAWAAFLSGSGAGVAGALLAWAVGRRLRQAVAPLLAWVAGVMFAVAAFDLLPAAWELAGPAATLAGLGLGAALLLALERLRLPAAEVVAWGIASHNFPEGLAIGAGFARERATGVAVTLLLALHDLPEGMAIALPEEAGAEPESAARGLRSALRALLAGLPTLLGAFLGYLAGVERLALALALGFAAGAMLEVTAGTLAPAAWARTGAGRRRRLLPAALAGCLAGWLFTRLVAG
ncbi:MAG: ZIP family metal transporter [Bacillota bacterium]|nr:ZIP family metal transporter [Bacillota bacterium]